MNKDIIDIIRDAAEMGAAQVIRHLSPVEDRISKAQACKEFGRTFIERNADRLTVTRHGNRLEYSRAELMQLRTAKSVAMLSVRINNNLLINK